MALKTVAAILCFLAGGLLAAGCGGGSTGTMGNQPPPPTFTTVDAPGAGMNGTEVWDINAGGSVVGFFEDANLAFHGFVRSPAGEYTTLDAPGAGTQGLGTSAYGINDSGTVVGTFADPQGFEHGFIRATDGTFTTFDAPGAEATLAYTINSGGTVAGTYSDVTGAHGYFRDSTGTFTTFDAPITPTSLALSRINASNTAVGYFQNSQVMFFGISAAPGGSANLLTVPGMLMAPLSGTEAFDINTSGEVVGAFYLPPPHTQPTSHSFVIDAMGNYTVFDPPMASPQGSEAQSINDSGEIVGDYLDANVIRHGYLREANGNFLTFDDPNAGQLHFSTLNQGTAPKRINASGTIAGFYSDAAGMRHGFILTNETNAQ